MRKRSVPSPGKGPMSFSIAGYVPSGVTAPAPPAFPSHSTDGWSSVVVKQEYASAAASADGGDPLLKRPRLMPAIVISAPAPGAAPYPAPPAPPSAKARRLGDSEVESLGFFGAAAQSAATALADRLCTPKSDKSESRCAPGRVAARSRSSPALFAAELGAPTGYAAAAVCVCVCACVCVCVRLRVRARVCVYL